MDRKKYTNQNVMAYKKPFKVEGDDKLKSKTWESMMKDATFYLDKPSVSEEKEMLNKLQFRYDSLFSGPMRPPLQSRKDLVSWVCQA